MSGKKYKTWGISRSNRLAHYNYTNDRPVHITICTKDKQAAFDSEIKAEIIIAELSNAVKGLKFKLLCYCLMPDHIHAIVSPADSGYSLARFLNFFKGRTTTIFRKRFGVSNLWQRSGFDHVIRKDEDLKATIEYILNNPVRKGIISAAEDYPHSRLFDEVVNIYL